MRIIKEIPHPDCRITIFHWNNKYILKLETSTLEQTFKIDEYEIHSEESLSNLISTEFLQQCFKRFGEMSVDLHKEVEKLD